MKKNGEDKQEWPIDLNVRFRLKMMPAFPSFSPMELIIRALHSYLATCNLGERLQIEEFAFEKVEDAKIITPAMAIPHNLKSMPQ